LERNGFRAGQVGRQKMPVVLTAAKKTPSNELSRSHRAWYIVDSVGNMRRV